MEEFTPSKASIGKRPVHPMLIPFPIAFIFFAPILDIVYLSTNDGFWAQASYYLLWGGFITGAIAAAVGLVDFLGVKRIRENRHAWYHIAANTPALLLALIDALMRKPDIAGRIQPWGLVMSVASAPLLVVGGWYGGELAYRDHVGVTENNSKDNATRLRSNA